MSEKYKIAADTQPHFVTCTITGWVDVFSREAYREKILESLSFCQSEKGLLIHAWVIMSNHLHLIVSSKANALADIIRDFKKYTAKQIIAAIRDNENESRREWMLNLFLYAGSRNGNNKEYQFWKSGYHPIVLDSPVKIEQRLKYLHENPVRAGWVREPQDYKYSSAVDYYTGTKGLLKIEL